MRKRKSWMVWVVVFFIIAICGSMVIHSQGNPTAKTKMASPVQKGVDPMEQEEKGRPSATHELGAIQISTSKEKPLTSEEKKLKEQGSLSGEGVTVIGDSVIIGVEPYLKEKLPEITVDGKVGRQMSQAQEVIDGLKTQGKLGDQIIIELGTNGPFKTKQLRSLLQSLSDKKRVLLITARVPKGWQDTVNKDIKEVAGEFSNAKVVDWYSDSEGKEDYFYKDGVHLKPEGGKYYASLLVAALQE